MAAAHLAHELPWGNLAEIFLLHEAPDATNVPWYTEAGEREKKKVAHFVRCLTSAVREFRASDDCSDDERRPFDPRTWPNQREYGAGAWVVFLPRLVPNNIVSNEWLLWILGHYDGGHPRELAGHLQLAFDGYELKPLTKEVTQILRDHAAMLFRCMFTISSVNEFIDDDAVE